MKIKVKRCKNDELVETFEKRHNQGKQNYQMSWDIRKKQGWETQKLANGTRHSRKQQIKRSKHCELDTTLMNIKFKKCKSDELAETIKKIHNQGKQNYRIGWDIRKKHN